MIYFQGTTDFYFAGPSVVTLGKFDGVHLGHQKLFAEVHRMTAQIKGASGVVFAFNAKQDELLLTDEEQMQIISDLGMDCLIRCPFVPEISGMSPDDFVRRILKNSLHASGVVVGTDFRFGHNRMGDAAWLKAHSEEYDLKVSVLDKETWHGQREISSTFMREALAAGDMKLYGELAGRNWSVSGTVVHGAHLGTSMGMPTCNLVPPAEKMLPPNGVYYGRSVLGGHGEEKQVFYSITNIGWKPTVGGTFRGVETYLYGAEGDFYGQNMTVELLHYVRPEQKFPSLDSLRRQIAEDIKGGAGYFHLTAGSGE